MCVWMGLHFLLIILYLIFLNCFNVYFLQNRLFLSDKIKQIVNEVYHNDNGFDIMSKHHKLTNYACYDEVRQHFYEECFDRTLVCIIIFSLKLINFNLNLQYFKNFFYTVL